MASKTRPIRPTAKAIYGAQYGSGSDEDEEYVGTKSARIPSKFGNCRIDFSKLELVSLQRYRKAYKLPDHPAASRDDLLAAIMRHFANVYVDEDETLIKFAMACRRNGQRLGLGSIAKKPRTGSAKPRGR
eukprot:GHRR01002613.1.p1 GENE.GHRR01002613.1~~GHRR01002613.1.p1  ORF type:complete len:130 (+),score=24.63 GHRR01002613.1:196-585(+)